MGKASREGREDVGRGATVAVGPQPTHMSDSIAEDRVTAGAETGVGDRAGQESPSSREEVSEPAHHVKEEGTHAGCGVEEELVEDQDSRAVIDQPFDPAGIRISTRRPTVSLVLQRISRDEIDLQTDHQRSGDLWPARTRSRLIESLLLKIPIPGFYMAADEDDNWKVADGLQRLGTLRDFVLRQELRLRGLEYLSRFEGYSYGDLPRPMQRRISETKLLCHVIEPGTPPDVMFNIFRRINTGGKPLVAQEIRHALNPGPARDLIAELARSAAFQRATDGSVSRRRMVDRECVVRFLAFRALGEKEYEGKLDDFLMHAMNYLDHDLERHPELTREFCRSMSLASDIFGGEAFRKPRRPGFRRNPVNKALFESLSVALADVSRIQAEELRHRKGKMVSGLARLMEEDAGFVVAISVGTGLRSNVTYRFKCMRELVEEALS